MTELRSRLAAASAAALLFASPLAQARQAAAQFNVNLSLATGATCGLTPTAPQVNCRSGAFVFGAVLQRDQLVLEGDGFAGLGTTAEYRVVSTPQQQYLELVVGW